MTLTRGEIWLAPFPYSDLTGSKRRPVCVVSPERFNAGADVLVAMVTSRGVDRSVPRLGDVTIEALAGSGLRVVSIVRTGRLFALERSKLIERLGLLDGMAMARIDDQLRLVLGLP